VATIDDGSTKYTARDLLPKEFYGFRILAVNSCGEGAPSKVVDVDTLEEPEDYEEAGYDDELKEYDDEKKEVLEEEDKKTSTMQATEDQQPDADIKEPGGDVASDKGKPKTDEE
ncbi:unnamed protein product, partial [Mesorhabditis spiculigera]